VTNLNLTRQKACQKNVVKLFAILAKIHYSSYMFKVLSPLSVPVRRFCRSGFTLVELLVVIGIIAILAGVALGPITRALKTAKQNAGMQTTRTLALAEFQYANDNSQNYPDKGNTGNGGGAQTASSVANCLMNGGYVSDPGIFYISGSSETKFSGTLPSPIVIPNSNISFDFAGNSTGTGVNPNAPDQLPLVWSSNVTVVTSVLATAVSGTSTTVTVGSTTPFGTSGMAVCYKSNSASFIVSTASGATYSVPLISSGYPGWANAVALPGGG
jgi:prepilin-type N-terminal cleavage/methylation domain-containing protein